MNQSIFIMIRLYDFKEKLKIRAKNTPCQNCNTKMNHIQVKHVEDVIIETRLGAAKVFECKFCDYATDRDCE